MRPGTSPIFRLEPTASHHGAASLAESPPDIVERPYRPISDYALIGNGHGAALVAKDGSIDWCCLDRFDAEPIFSRLLDRKQGGFFLIAPATPHEAVRAYHPDTNVLETVFYCPDGEVRLIDFMTVPDLSGQDSPSYLVRLVRGVSGQVTVDVSYRPVAGFRPGFPELEIAGGRIAAESCPVLVSTADFRRDGTVARARMTVKAGESVSFHLVDPVHDVASLVPDDLLTASRTCWKEWSEARRYEGPFARQVTRSALVLKALTYRPTGAIVAAPTTSLPEHAGGVRNWDYRFCWLRDACLCFYAMKKFGSTLEAERFFSFLIDTFETGETGKLNPLYGIDGTVELSERTIDHYEGYRGSRPVRIGNEAGEQHQVDVYGQILDLIHLYCSLGGELGGRLRRIGITMADYVAAHWQEPDSGLWEPRLAPKRYVHAAIMNWVALDRAIRLFGPRPEWLVERDAIVAAVRQEGVHAGGYLTQVFGGDDVDAAVLIAPMVDFPIDEQIIERTVDVVIDRLGHGPLVYRYKGDDGLPGHEGTFVLCAFWLVDALIWLGRFDEAKANFGALLDLGNDVGLYPEEFAADGTFLGNFPQAFSHLGLIHSALVLDLYAAGGKAAVRGTYADRALRETPNRSPASIDKGGKTHPQP